MANKARRLTDRKEQAVIRNEERARRSDSEQLSLLDMRLGEGLGAVRERARLHRKIEEHTVRNNKKKKNKKV